MRQMERINKMPPNATRMACCVLMLGAATVAGLPSQTLTTLADFCYTAHCINGANPEAGLVQATDGDLYGTTEGGGANGSGTVFKITPSGTLTTIYAFCAETDCTDGQYPEAGLVQAANGDFYGTTYSGGANDSGTVFRIAPSGKLTTLYSFCPQSGCTDGESPEAGLVQATNGDLYGTTRSGGNSSEYWVVYQFEFS
jgi:uncharacterized repeat protein (TIGR03803 family)